MSILELDHGTHLTGMHGPDLLALFAQQAEDLSDPFGTLLGAVEDVHSGLQSAGIDPKQR